MLLSTFFCFVKLMCILLDLLRQSETTKKSNTTHKDPTLPPSSIPRTRAMGRKADERDAVKRAINARRRRERRAAKASAAARAQVEDEAVVADEGRQPPSHIGDATIDRNSGYHASIPRVIPFDAWRPDGMSRDLADIARGILGVRNDIIDACRRKARHSKPHSEMVPAAAATTTTSTQLTATGHTMRLNLGSVDRDAIVDNLDVLARALLACSEENSNRIAAIVALAEMRLDDPASNGYKPLTNQ